MSSKPTLVARLESYFNHLWYEAENSNWLLLPFSLLFYVVSNIRRLFWQLPSVSNPALPVPVVVVGNINVGGSGKTPLIITLCELLKAEGLQPGVVSRGYKSQAPSYPHLVSEFDSAEIAGDEPLLISQRTGCPVVIAPDRYAAATYLLNHTNADIILSDDGLQHYALPREMEIIVVDAERQFGNQQLLPSGPLRESVRSIKQEQWLVFNGMVSNNRLLNDDLPVPKTQQGNYRLEPTEWLCLNNVKRLSPIAFKQYLHDQNQTTVVAIAGIGNPERFYNTVQGLHVTVLPKMYEDHAAIDEDEIIALGQSVVVMTEKDAVKMQAIFQHRSGANAALPECWFLKVDAVLESDFQQRLIKAVNALISKK